MRLLSVRMLQTMMTTSSNRRPCLFIDLETYSGADLKKVSAYKYCEEKDFRILLLAFSFDDEPVTVLEMPTRETLPADLLEALTDPQVIKYAHNAAFERVCLSYAFGDGLNHRYLDPEQWRCTMIWANELGLPSPLKHVGIALHCEKAKLEAGTLLISYFSKPCKPTKVNGMRTRNLPEDAPDKWADFVYYNKVDVEVLQEIQQKLQVIGEIPDSEWQLYAIDQRINDNGVLLDKTMVQNVVDYLPEYTAALKEECLELTGCNLNSIVQLKEWIRKESGITVPDLSAATVAAMLQNPDLPANVQRLLKLRQKAGKSSLKKYPAMYLNMCSDGRARGCFRFYGGATGRWAGRIIQFQNLPSRLAFTDFDPARECVLEGDFDYLRLLYGAIPDALSTLIRTAIVPAPGKKLVVADYSAIEARVIAWVAGEKWRQEAFARGEDIYCQSASQMFGVPVEKHGRNADLRKKGKIAELACGYGGGVAALVAFGADKMGLTQSEMESIIRKWRDASPKICRLWRDVEDGVRGALANGSARISDKLRAYKEGKTLYIVLPDGRRLAYCHMRLTPDGLVYQKHTGVNWSQIGTWGGKLTENIIQAIARDCLGQALKLISADPDYRIIAHVHDEIIAEVDADRAEELLERMEAYMAQLSPWQEGLLLTADGFVSDYYKKD